jgi:hypothetical protein
MVVKVENSINSFSSTVSPVSTAREEMKFLLIVETREIHLSSKSINRHILIEVVVEQDVCD